MHAREWVVLGIIITLVCGVGYCVRDYWTAVAAASEVTVVDKSYTPGYYTTDCHPVPHSSAQTCDQDWHAPTWSVKYEDGTERYTTSVTSGTYERLRLGDRVWLSYRQGRGYFGLRYREEFLLAKPAVEGWK